MSEHLSKVIRTGDPQLSDRSAEKNAAKRLLLSAKESYRYWDKLSAEEYAAMHISIKDRVFFEQIIASNIVRQRLTKPSQTIVDIGAGNCNLANLIHKMGPPESCRMIALDNSANMLRNAVANQKALPFVLQTVVAEATSMPLQKGIADVAFVINVTPYINELAPLARELTRVIKKGGLLVIVHPERSIFWEAEFEGLQVKFDHRVQEVFELVGFKLLEDKPINVHPVAEIESITLRIATWMAFEK